MPEFLVPFLEIETQCAVEILVAFPNLILSHDQMRQKTFLVAPCCNFESASECEIESNALLSLFAQWVLIWNQPISRLKHENISTQLF